MNETSTKEETHNGIINLEDEDSSQKSEHEDKPQQFNDPTFLDDNKMDITIPSSQGQQKPSHEGLLNTHELECLQGNTEIDLLKSQDEYIQRFCMTGSCNEEVRSRPCDDPLSGMLSESTKEFLQKLEREETSSKLQSSKVLGDYQRVLQEMSKPVVHVENPEVSHMKIRSFGTNSIDTFVHQWLLSLNLPHVEKYIHIFKSNEVDWQSLKLLSEAQLMAMGVTAIGPLNKMTHSIRTMRNLQARNPHSKDADKVAKRCESAASNAPPMRFHLAWVGERSRSVERLSNEVRPRAPRPISAPRRVPLYMRARDKKSRDQTKRDIIAEEKRRAPSPKRITISKAEMMKKVEREIAEAAERRRLKEKQEQERREFEAKQSEMLKVKRFQLAREYKRRMHDQVEHDQTKKGEANKSSRPKKRQRKPKGTRRVHTICPSDARERPCSVVTEKEILPKSTISPSENQECVRDSHLYTQAAAGDSHLSSQAGVGDSRLYTQAGTGDSRLSSQAGVGDGIVTMVTLQAGQPKLAYEDEISQVELQIQNLLHIRQNPDPDPSTMLADIDQLEAQLKAIQLLVAQQRAKVGQRRTEKVVQVPFIQKIDSTQGEILFSERDRVGEGAFTTVFRGSLSGRPVAVKRIRSALRPEDLKELHAEVGRLSLLQHPRIVHLYTCSTRTPLPVLVCEFVAGESLNDWILTRKPLDHCAFYQIAEDVVMALSYLHQHVPLPVTHLRVCPRNVLIETRENPRAKLADVGLNTLRFRDGEIMVSEDYEGRTTSHLPWSSPEHISGLPTGSSSDIYSLGVLLWTMLARQRPYEGLTKAQTRERILSGPPLALPDTCPLGLKDLIQVCWLADPGRRPTAQEVRLLLSHLKVPPSWRALFQSAGIDLAALSSVAILRRLVAAVLGLPKPSAYGPGPCGLLTSPLPSQLELSRPGQVAEVNIRLRTIWEEIQTPLVVEDFDYRFSGPSSVTLEHVPTPVNAGDVLSSEKVKETEDQGHPDNQSEESDPLSVELLTRGAAWEEEELPLEEMCGRDSRQDRSS